MNSLDSRFLIIGRHRVRTARGRFEPAERNDRMAKAKKDRQKDTATTKAPTRQMWRRSIVGMVLLIGVCFSAVIG